MAQFIEEKKRELQAKLENSDALDKLQGVESSFRKVMKELFAEMKALPNEQKKEVGAAINDFKKEFEERIAAAKKKISELSKTDAAVDLTVPSPEFIRGKIHPLIRVGRMFEDVYKEMGFSIAYGPEIENDKHNYEMLNMPYYHPARDMQDTFYLEYPKVLLRSHTSCVQVREPP